jgi:hypothetical protein
VLPLYQKLMQAWKSALPFLLRFKIYTAAPSLLLNYLLLIDPVNILKIKEIKELNLSPSEN